MKKITSIFSITLALFSLFSCTVDSDTTKTLLLYTAMQQQQDPETVTNLRVIEGKESAMLVWDAAIYESTKYRISYRKSSDSEENAVNVEVENPKKYYYKSLYNLENNTEYSFSVTAIQSTGRVSATEKVVSTPKEKLAVKAKPSDTTTTEIELEAVPDKPNDFVWCRMMTPESYEAYLNDHSLEGKTFYSNPGDNTNGIFAVGSIYQLNGDGNLIENNVGALDRLMIQNSGVVKNNLRDGEGVHWFTIRRVGAHWEIYGYLYNKKFEESLLNGTTSVEEKTSSDEVWFDTVKDMEECSTIYHNSTADSYNGVTIRTRGYYAIGDGGAATYTTASREIFENKRARKRYYKYFDHRTATGQIVNYVLGNIDCDVNGDGTAESVLGINMKQLGAGKCTLITDRSMNEKYTNNDDAERWNDAMNMLYDWSDANNANPITIYFPAGEYRLGQSIGPIGPYIRVIGDTDILTSDLSKIDENKITRTKNSYGWETQARSKDASKRTVLYTDNGGSYGEAQFSIWDCSHFYMRGITMECRKTKRVSHTTERMVYIAGDLQNLTSEDDAIQDITVEGCEIYVDENCHKDDGNLDRQFTSITVYTGVKNVNIKNNLLVNMSGVERGACYGVFDFWGNGDASSEIGGTEDILLEGNLMYHNCHDESGGIFTTGHPRDQKPNCYVHRVTIRGNEMHPMSSNASSRTMCFTMAYGVSFNIRDVLFENNHVIADFPSKLMTFGHFDTVSDASKTTSDFVDSEGNIYGVVVRNNTFDICQHWNNSYVFEANKYAWIHDNTINIIKGADGNAATCGSIFQGGAAYDNNIVTDEADGKCSAGGLAYMAGRLRNNTVTMHGHIGSIASATFDVRNNTITLNKRLSVMFSTPDVSSDITISGNTINYNISAGTSDTDSSMDFVETKDTGWQHTHVLSLGRYGTKDNSYTTYTVNFTNNTILAPNAQDNDKHILYSKFPDYDPNIINIKNNKLEKFTWVRSQMGALPHGALTYSGNVDANGNALEFSMEEGNYKNFIKGARETNPSE